MEGLEALRIRGPLKGVRLELERVVGGRLVPSVDLEILEQRGDLRAKLLEKWRLGEGDGRHAAGQEDNGQRSRTIHKEILRPDRANGTVSTPNLAMRTAQTTPTERSLAPTGVGGVVGIA